MSASDQFDPGACALDVPTLIEASAGTGKTWNLSALYLRLLLERELTVEQILVVTFTKAATAELHDRIRTRIADMLDALRHGPADADSFLQALATRLIDQQGKSREQLIKLLELALQSFDQAAICTIHSFCQRALAESPFAAGMPFTTEIVQDDREELAEVVNDFWRRKLGVAAEQALDQDFAQFLLDRGDTPEKIRRL